MSSDKLFQASLNRFFPLIEEEEEEKQTSTKFSRTDECRQHDTNSLRFLSLNSPPSCATAAASLPSMKHGAHTKHSEDSQQFSLSAGCVVSLFVD